MTDLLEGTYVPNKQQWVRDQVAAYEASDGAEANTLMDTDYLIVVVTGKGAKNPDNLYKNPVMRVERDGDYLAVASKGGAPENPAWYHNYKAHPVVQLQDGAEPALYRVRELDGAERADWWEHAVATWPTYAEYQKKTDRQIPLLLLEPDEAAKPEA